MCRLLAISVSFQSIVSSYLLSNWKKKLDLNVSVSSQSIISSYEQCIELIEEDEYNPFPSPFRVSFLLKNYLTIILKYAISFRLLSEYHFFLKRYKINKQIKFKSFRLLSEYHFFLSPHTKTIIRKFYIVSVSFQSIISSYYSKIFF